MAFGAFGPDKPARPRGLTAKAVGAILCDASSYGCRILSPVKHPPGERLWLRLNGGMPMAATVIWCEDGRIGCRFDESLPRDQMRRLIIA